MPRKTRVKKDKVLQLKNIMIGYKKALMKKGLDADGYFMVLKESQKKGERDLQYETAVIEKIDRILDQLSLQSRIIITNIFILNKGSDWRVEHYSRSTYYRHLDKAIDEFFCYYD